MKESTHPDPSQLRSYLLGTLSWVEMEQVEQHQAKCTDCQTLLNRLDAEEDSFAAGLRKLATVSAIDPVLERLVNRARSGQTVDYEKSDSVSMVAGHHLMEKLGQGGLGKVYLVRHPELGDLRALKRPLLDNGLSQSSILARFYREVRAVGSLRHDHIIRAYDAGTDGEGPYLIMEYLEGETLGKLIEQHKGLLPVTQVCDLVQQAAKGLQAAHERGLVHRDIKPSNLMLAKADAGMRVVIIDWGLAKMSQDKDPEPAEAEVTAANVILGTPDFLAPEQGQDARSVDIRADIYSLGVTFYCLLTGQPPFHDRPKLDKVLCHQQKPFPSLNTVRNDVPEGVSTILHKMVRKRPEDRYFVPAEVVAALEPFCGKPVPAPLPRPRDKYYWMAIMVLIFLIVSVSIACIYFANVGSQLPPHPNPADPGNYQRIELVGQHKGLCTSIAFLSDGERAVSESGGGAIYIWDLNKQRHAKTELHYLQKESETYSGFVAVPPNGKYFAAAGVNPTFEHMDIISLYSQSNYKRLDNNFSAKAGKFTQTITISQDGSRFAVVDIPNTLTGVFINNMYIDVFISPKTSPKKLSIQHPANGLAFSPDGNYLVSCSDQHDLSLWNVKTAQVGHKFKGHTGAVDQVGYSKDGKTVFSASAADDTLRVWNANLSDKNIGKQIKKISMKKVNSKMLCAAFALNKRAVTGHVDGQVALWDLDTEKNIARFRNKGGRVNAVAISSDGSRALAALANGKVMYYKRKNK